jgi:hypothetical protein
VEKWPGPRGNLPEFASDMQQEDPPPRTKAAVKENVGLVPHSSPTCKIPELHRMQMVHMFRMFINLATSLLKGPYHKFRFAGKYRTCDAGLLKVFNLSL